MHSDLVNVILKDAPILAGTLISPAAGMVLHLVASFFGGDAADPVALATKIAGDTDASDKLSSLEAQFKQLLGQGNRPMSSIKFNLEIHYENDQSEESK